MSGAPENRPPERILLAVSGMTPQVITETLYALLTEQHWVPDRVRLITTLQGRERALTQLLEGERHFQRLLADYSAAIAGTAIRFDAGCISVIRAADGRELADLHTPQDNAAAADTIVGVIRELTAAADTELHVSLAGGRKTMGFYAGYALSLFGRRQDRLSHVLVSEDYESNPQFFYPTPQPRSIRGRDGRPLDASRARVWLADIPFVRLRNQLPEILLAETHSFSDTVRLAREATEPVRLTLYPAPRRWRINRREGRLPPVQMALLLWVACRARDGQPPLAPLIEGESFPADEFLATAATWWLELSDKTKHSLQHDGITQPWLEQTISRLNKTLERALGPELAERCKLASRSHDGRRGYALPADLQLAIERESAADD